MAEFVIYLGLWRQLYPSLDTLTVAAMFGREALSYFQQTDGRSQMADQPRKLYRDGRNNEAK